MDIDIGLVFLTYKDITKFENDKIIVRGLKNNQEIYFTTDVYFKEVVMISKDEFNNTLLKTPINPISSVHNREELKSALIKYFRLKKLEQIL